MEAVLMTWSTKDLKAECQKNGMAQYGDKSQLIQRILDNIPGKRRSYDGATRGVPREPPILQ